MFTIGGKFELLDGMLWNFASSNLHREGMNYESLLFFKSKSVELSTNESSLLFRSSKLDT